MKDKPPPLAVGDLVRVQNTSQTATRYAGRRGRVESISSWTGTVLVSLWGERIPLAFGESQLVREGSSAK